MTQPYNFFYRVILIGDDNVGKTSILVRFVEDTFKSSLVTTIGERVVIITDTLVICLAALSVHGKECL